MKFLAALVLFQGSCVLPVPIIVPMPEQEDIEALVFLPLVAVQGGECPGDLICKSE